MCGFCYRSQPSLSSAKSSQHSTIYITTAEQRIRIRRQLQQQGDLSPEQQPRRPTQRPLASSVSSQLLDVSVDVSRQGELAAWVWERSGASASTLQQQQRRQQQEWRGGGGISSGGHANVGSTPTREMQAPLLPVVEWSNSSGKDDTSTNGTGGGWGERAREVDDDAALATAIANSLEQRFQEGQS
eukprot:COSAG05_NODE_2454_length_3040_cov_5.465353_3_plen_186_part_00